MLYLYIILLIIVVCIVHKWRNQIYEQFSVSIKIDNPFRAKAIAEGSSPSPHPHPHPHPGKQRYTCGVKGCEESVNGEYGSLYLCKQHCTHYVPPHPGHKKRYSCSKDGCVEDSKGKYTSLKQCMKACGHIDSNRYSCIVGKGCEKNITGAFASLDECQNYCSGIIPTKKGTYDCLNGKCIENRFGTGKYSSLSTCKMGCLQPIPTKKGTYDCMGSTCVPNVYGTGKYSNLAECEQKCMTPIIPTKSGTYDCLGGVCVENPYGTGKYNNLEVCQAHCKTPIIPTKKGTYDCANDSCIENGYGTGKYANLAECQSDCTPPVIPVRFGTYDCIKGKCIPNLYGTGKYPNQAACLASPECKNVTPIPTKKGTYDCVSGVCVENKYGTGKYSSLELCQNSVECKSVTPIPTKGGTYDCVSGVCVENKYGKGKYPSLELCQNSVECKSVTPIPTKGGTYDCIKGVCVENKYGKGKYPSQAVCLASSECSIPTKGGTYDCIKGVCVENKYGTGKYPSQAACLASLECNSVTPIPTKGGTYDCIKGVCIENKYGTGKYPSQTACLASLECKTITPIPTKKGTYDCIGGKCIENIYGTGKYPSLELCQNSTECSKPDPPSGNVPTQDWINKNIMFPMLGALHTNKKAKNPGAYFAYDKEANVLVRYDKTGKPLMYGDVCPYGSQFKNGNCYDGDGKTIIRGVKTVNAGGKTYPTTKKPKILLTNYALFNKYSALQTETVFYEYISFVLNNFRIPINLFSVYIIDGGDQTKSWLTPEALYNGFISECDKKAVKAGINVYPSFVDSGWKKQNVIINGKTIKNSTFTAIGQYIERINAYAAQKGSKGIQFMVFDKEGCSCGDVDPVRQMLKIGYNDLPTEFLIFSSLGPSMKFSNGNPNDIGLGEVYWNVGQSWPCGGNYSQTSYYTSTCKQESSQRVFLNKPDEYITYLINSSTQPDKKALNLKYCTPIKGYDRYKSTGPICTPTNQTVSTGYGMASSAPLTKIYKPVNGNFTVPLFSTEMLYQKSDGTDNGTMCVGMAFDGAKGIFTTADKVCGTFDGFGYWSYDKFYEFLIKYANQFDLNYVGIYDAMFLPETWFTKPFPSSLIPDMVKNVPTWPKNCTELQNKCAFDCIQLAIVPCTNNDICNNYCPYVGGYCNIKTGSTQGACHFNKPVDCTDSANKCNSQCYMKANVKCSDDSTCNNYCPSSSGISGSCVSGKCKFNPPPDCSDPKNKCTDYCGPRQSVPCKTNADCTTNFCGGKFKGSYCREPNSSGQSFCHISM